jgi:hypothetical protein
MTAYTGVALIYCVIIVGVGEIWYLNVLALPAVVASSTVFPPSDRMRDIGSQHPSCAVAHTAIGIVVARMISCQHWGSITPWSMTVNAILIRDSILLFCMGDRRLS